MRRIDALLEAYGDSHHNPVNKLIHWVCVPAIYWSVVAGLWSLPFPLETGIRSVPVNWATLMLLLAQIYYFSLSLRLGLGLLLFSVFLVQLTVLLEYRLAWPLWQVALAVFIVAWIGQFIGHVAEGKRPSFLSDLQFLLIGPAWLMAFAYRALGLRY